MSPNVSRTASTAPKILAGLAEQQVRQRFFHARRELQRVIALRLDRGRRYPEGIFLVRAQVQVLAHAEDHLAHDLAETVQRLLGLFVVELVRRQAGAAEERVEAGRGVRPRPCSPSGARRACSRLGLGSALGGAFGGAGRRARGGGVRLSTSAMAVVRRSRPDVRGRADRWSVRQRSRLAGSSTSLRFAALVACCFAAWRASSWSASSSIIHSMPTAVISCPGTRSARVGSGGGTR